MSQTNDCFWDFVHRKNLVKIKELNTYIQKFKLHFLIKTRNIGTDYNS